MWSNLTAGITTLGLALILTFFLYNVGVQPLLNYDYDSFFNTQTKSVVYTPGILDIDAHMEPLSAGIIKQYDPKMFTVEHMIMLPAVDVESTLGGERVLAVWQRLTYSPTPSTPNTLIGQFRYPMSTEALYDKTLTLLNVSPDPMSYYNYRTSAADPNFNIMILGVPNSTTLIFYRDDKLERQRER